MSTTTTLETAAVEPGQTITWRGEDGETRSGQVVSVRAAGTMKASSGGKLYTVHPGELVTDASPGTPGEGGPEHTLPTTPGAGAPGSDGGGEGAGATAAPLPQDGAVFVGLNYVAHADGRVFRRGANGEVTINGSDGLMVENPTTDELNEARAAFGLPPVDPPADKPARTRKPKAKFVVEIPARLLHVVGVAAKEEGKYQMNGVLVETTPAESPAVPTVSAAATDGRRLLVATGNVGMFDGHGSAFVPRMVARNAAKIAISRPQDDKSGAMVTLARSGNECHLTAYTPDGPVEFTWDVDPDQKFPPYRDVIPVWETAADKTVGKIGITNELVAGTLKAMQKVVGKDPKVRVYLPAAEDKPLGLESQDGETVRALAVVMPTVVDGWVEPKPKPDGEKPPLAAEAERPAGIAEPDAWKTRPTDTLCDYSLREARLPEKVAGLLKENGVTTLALVAELQASHYERPKIGGLGKAKQQLIDDAMVAFFAVSPGWAAAAEKPPEDGPATPDTLTWQDEASGTSSAANTAGIMIGDGETPARFRVGPAAGGEFSVALSSAELLPIRVPEPFESVEAARRWCQSRNDDIAADGGATVAGVVAAQDAAAAKPAKKAKKKREPEPAGT